MKKKKVALMLSGQARYLDNPYSFKSHYKHILEKYDTDVFSFIWFDKNIKNFEVSTWSTIKDSCCVDNNTLEKINNKYNPKVLKFKSPKFFKFGKNIWNIIQHRFGHELVTNPHWNEKNFSNIISQLYSIEQTANILKSYIKENDMKYDFIIYSRYDNQLIDFPDLENLSSDYFYLSNHHNEFPDLMFVAGQKFLKAFKYYSSIIEAVQNIKGLQPEQFKKFTFANNFDLNLLKPILMKVHVVREENDCYD